MKFHFASIARPSEVSESDWNSWTWQLRNSLKTLADFQSVFNLSSAESLAFSSNFDSKNIAVKGELSSKEQKSEASQLFNIRTTPYYARLAGPNELDPIRRILMPTSAEISPGLQQMLDPLAEKKNNPAPRIIHRYSDRVLFLVTDICSVYCRYCTRKHFTGQEQAFIKNSEYEQALAYLRKATGIREVILSGGDPLTLSNAQLDRVLFDLRKIDHIEIIRIGTRIPVVCPMRVDHELVQIIRKAKPVYLMTHFNHPRELTAEAAASVEMFVDHGIPVMNQMVLLNGVNNSAAIVQALSRRLIYLRAKPYYMFQCDPSIGTDHLRTSVENSLQIQKELWGHLSGLAMPNFAVDIPAGGGKTYYVPNFEKSHSENIRHYVGWDGVQADYISPAESSMLTPLDSIQYEEEWRKLKDSKKII